MFQKFDEDSKKILKKAKLEMQRLKHPFVGSEHLILSILSFNNLYVTKVLNEYNIDYDKFKKELIKTIGIGNSLNSYFVYTPLLKNILENAILYAKDLKESELSPDMLFLAILEEGEGVGIRVLNNLGVDLDSLYKEFENKNNNKKYNRKKLLIKEYGIDLIEEAKDNKIELVVGRDKEINRLIEILLRKNKNNPLLIGGSGVGKTAIVEGLALKIFKREVPKELIDKKIISVSMANLVAGTKYRGEFEEKVEKLIKEIENNPDIIVFIDEIHSIVGAGGAEGAIDASNILKPALSRGKFRLIGATTLEEYKNTIEKDKALNRRFQTILVNEPNLEETENILKGIKPFYESFHNVLISDLVISKIVSLSDKYIFDRKNPDKSIDILDEACTRCSLYKDNNTKNIEELKNRLESIYNLKNNYIINQDFIKASELKKEELEIENKINKLLLNQNKKKREVTILDVASIIKSKSNIPVYEIDKESNNNLKKLETRLNNKIIGQKEAIKKIVFETKKYKLGLKNNNKPISFLFIGKSGIGKTYLAKTYAKELKMNLIRIDASEYKESHSISKIIGSPPGYVGYSSYSILDDIKNNPFSVILIDEIEKGCNSFINLFLQILDEGFITNSSHEKIYFNHTIIIMTSNNTSNINSIGFNNNKEYLVNNSLENTFSIEFLNRIDNIIYFNELNLNDIKLIINKEIKNIKNKYLKQNIDLNIDKNIIKEIIKLSNYKVYGARNIKRLLEDKIDSIAIDSLLNGNKSIYIS